MRRGRVAKIVEVRPHLISPHQIVLGKALVTGLPTRQFAECLNCEAHVKRRSGDRLLKRLEADPSIVRWVNGWIVIGQEFPLSAPGLYARATTVATWQRVFCSKHNIWTIHYLQIIAVLSAARDQAFCETLSVTNRRTWMAGGPADPWQLPCFRPYNVLW
jgi:hypothetical protein